MVIERLDGNKGYCEHDADKATGSECEVRRLTRNTVINPDAVVFGMVKKRIDKRPWVEYWPLHEKHEDRRALAFIIH